MSSHGKNRYLVWLNQAKFDISSAELSLQNRFYEWSCYQSVQAAEKVLKSVLIHAGWRPPKIHKLGILLSMCNHAHKDFFDVKLNYRKLETFTFISRYPFVIPGNSTLTPHEMITKDDAMACLDIASEVVKMIEIFLGRKNAVEGENQLDMENVYYTEDEIERRIEEVVTKISTNQTLNTKKIILFGSFARERTRPKTSTMDLLIVADTELSFIERISYVREITRGSEPIIEPLIYTSKEFSFMLKEEGEGFLESAIEEGKVLFEN